MPRRSIVLSAIGLGCLGAVSWSPGAAAAPRDMAMLQGLDKVTARTSTFTVGLDEAVRFGSLTITLRHCERSPPTEPPEATAFLEIVDTPPGEEPRWAFSGWMFASSPAVSAMEHPVYDVRVLECLARGEAAPGSDPGQAGGQGQ